MKEQIIQQAYEAGFSLCRVTTADPIPSEHLVRWIADGCHGTMRYMARDPEKRCDPKSLLPEAKSVICCALAYGIHGVIPTEPAESGRVEESLALDLSLPALHSSRFTLHGSIARFARGADYHIVVREKLDTLVSVMREHNPELKAKCCVDTSPVLEKALAARAGIGWIGKHTLLVNPDFGSWFVVGEIITDIELTSDAPIDNRCGACMKCIENCPADALKEKTLDARKCISYLTIECKDKLGSDSYGCDLCQEVCPYNQIRNQNFEIRNKNQ